MTFIKIATASFAAAAILSGPAMAQGLNTSFANVQPGDYTIEKSHTRILFSVMHMGFSTWYGDFSKATGTASIDPANPAADSLDVSIPTASISTTNETLDGELKAADWFDAEKYPTITFKSRHFTVTGPGKGQIAGDLTFHGVTRPVTLDVSFNGSGPNPLSKAYTAGFEASGKIRRSDFGVKKYVPLIGDDVNLIISAALEKKKP